MTLHRQAAKSGIRTAPCHGWSTAGGDCGLICVCISFLLLLSERLDHAPAGVPSRRDTLRLCSQHCRVAVLLHRLMSDEPTARTRTRAHKPLVKTLTTALALLTVPGFFPYRVRNQVINCLDDTVACPNERLLDDLMRVPHCTSPRGYRSNPGCRTSASTAPCNGTISMPGPSVVSSLFSTSSQEHDEKRVLARVGPRRLNGRESGQ